MKMTDIELDPIVKVIKPSAPFLNNNQPNEIIVLNGSSAHVNSSDNRDNAEEKYETRDSFNASASSISNHFDNKAFELEDTVLEEHVNPFSRQDRPGSMMSIKTIASNVSRSSVNCASGRVKCPNSRLNKFISYREETGFNKASEEIKKLILEKDGAFIGNWLLIEISTWDFHREKIVLLTEKTLFIITYDFIKSCIHFYKRISLSDINKVHFGSLKYPNKSLMGEYDYGAVKVCWGNDKLTAGDKWNPFNDKVPFKIFTSHHIIYSEKEKETTIFNCDEFINSLEYAVSKLPDGIHVEFKEQTIQIENYINFASTLFNQNWLGFQLDRNGVSF